MGHDHRSVEVKRTARRPRAFSELAGLRDEHGVQVVQLGGLSMDIERRRAFATCFFEASGVRELAHMCCGLRRGIGNG